MQSPTNTCTRIVLAERPKVNIEPSTFRVERVPLSDLRPVKAGNVLVRTAWVSLDPAMRGWLNDTRSYIEPVRIGAVMRAMGLGVVVDAGEGSTHRVGDIVSGLLGEFGARVVSFFFLELKTIFRVDGIRCVAR